MRLFGICRVDLPDLGAYLAKSQRTVIEVGNFSNLYGKFKDMNKINSSIKETEVRKPQLAKLSVGEGEQPLSDNLAEIKMQTVDLNFYYGKFKALANINLSVQARKITAIIGPSGCGKSTLLRGFNRMNDLVPHDPG